MGKSPGKPAFAPWPRDVRCAQRLREPRWDHLFERHLHRASGAADRQPPDRIEGGREHEPVELVFGLPIQ
jgi:hypothetical protein